MIKQEIIKQAIALITEEQNYIEQGLLMGKEDAEALAEAISLLEQCLQ